MKVADILKEAEEEIFTDMLQMTEYAGTAYCSQNKSDAKFWLGQYLALKRTRKAIQERRFRMMAAEEFNPAGERVEGKTQ